MWTNNTVYINSWLHSEPSLFNNTNSFDWLKVSYISTELCPWRTMSNSVACLVSEGYLLTKSSSTNFSLSSLPSLRSSLGNLSWYEVPLRGWKLPLRCRCTPCLSLSPPTLLGWRPWWWWPSWAPREAPCQLGVSFQHEPPASPPCPPLATPESTESCLRSREGCCHPSPRERTNVQRK